MLPPELVPPELLPPEVVALELVLDWLTVTVTVVVDRDLVVVVPFAVLVWEDFLVRVELSLIVLGGATVTVLDEVVLQRPGVFTLPQTPLWGGAMAELVGASVVVVSPPVSVPLSVPVAVAEVEVGESVHEGVPTIRQMERPMPVVVELSAGSCCAASAAPGRAEGGDPPETTMLTGTAATTTSGAQNRARARSRADRSRRCTALPSQGDQAPRPARDRAAVHMFASWRTLCQRSASLWHGGRMDDASA